MNPLITSKPVSDGQKSQFITVVTDAVRKSVGTAIEELVAKEVLNSDNFQGILGDGGSVAAAINATVKQMMEGLAAGVRGCLRLISCGRQIFVRATDGRDTLAEASDVFKFVDPKFNDLGLNRLSGPTRKQQFEIYQLVETASLMGIFTSLRRNLDSLCFTQAQIKAICRDHHHELEDGSAKMPNLFLFKAGNEFFVAWVYRSGVGEDRRPTVRVYGLGEDCKHIHNSNRVYVFLPKL